VGIKVFQRSRSTISEYIVGKPRKRLEKDFRAFGVGIEYAYWRSAMSIIRIAAK
jgi:hypothetical protein